MAEGERVMEDLIKRSDAIKALDDGMNKWYSNVTLRQSMRDAINSIPSAEPTVDKDYLVNLIQEAVYDGEACKRLIEMVEPKPGEWTNAGVLTVQCSNCKSQFHELEAMNFCPNCGARMKGVDE